MLQKLQLKKLRRRLNHWINNKITGYSNSFVVLCGTAKELIFMNILQELWYGNIRPNEDKVISDEEKELVTLIECQAFEIIFKSATMDC